MEDMSYWKEVWERKGRDTTRKLEVLDGYESTTANVAKIAKNIIKELDIKETDTVLEVACGAGGLAQYINCKSYVGVDYSTSLVKKHIELLNNSVLHGEASNLIFKNNTFDKVFCFGAFHYFPNQDYAQKAIDEMKRIAKKAIFIGDLPITSHREQHLLYNKDNFKDWKITDGYYNPCRFNVSLKLD
ncbi:MULTISPECIES: class I SAM-dependent methyltransferase [Clostridium]|uniref:Class I SAM-dependent methyltransferase n=1 Tax=Clostridium aquiflavi TaxID=3073603 RepID=A0ABU1EEZ9_9CLOT|nr:MULTISPECIES: class I SAM-dependent methyltransferase [unclassified Clostridium]MDR5586960.1 class I SAM-dependent methyltransferase [Clostridium sp. 5N-1]NFG60425.1 class I SAM-dependent methyltransferase [Clostridium botulinum]NFQ09932.1 class I SAM-dependent methyltransferase [Clostridium botulinum]